MPIQSPYATRLAAIPVVDSEVEIMGTRTRYWTYGSADAPTTVIICHGYRGEHHGIEPIIAFLPGIRFISPDIPGFGESDPLSTTHSVENYARWFTAFAEAVDPTHRAVVLGHSFGSIITAASVADGLPAPALILINPIAISALAGPHPILTRLTAVFYEATARLPERMAERLLGSWLVVRVMSETMAKTKSRSLRRFINDQHHRYFSRFADRSVVVEGFRASVRGDVTGVAARITVPTLLVAARRDDITPVAAQFELQKRLPDAELVVLDNVGHLIHYEVPDQAAAAIEAFIARVVGSPRGATSATAESSPPTA